jgi:hypothetical protein
MKYTRTDIIKVLTAAGTRFSAARGLFQVRREFEKNI